MAKPSERKCFSGELPTNAYNVPITIVEVQRPDLGKYVFRIHSMLFAFPCFMSSNEPTKMEDLQPAVQSLVLSRVETIWNVYSWSCVHVENADHVAKLIYANRPRDKDMRAWVTTEFQKFPNLSPIVVSLPFKTPLEKLCNNINQLTH